MDAFVMATNATPENQTRNIKARKEEGRKQPKKNNNQTNGKATLA